MAGHGVSLAAAANLLPGRGGKSVNPATVFRWCTKGVRSPAGHRICLEAVRVGTRYVTTRAAVERFVVRTTQPTAAVEEIRSPAARHKAAVAAMEKLKEMGC